MRVGARRVQGLWTVVGVQAAKPIKTRMSPQLYVRPISQPTSGLAVCDPPLRCAQEYCTWPLLAFTCYQLWANAASD